MDRRAKAGRGWMPRDGAVSEATAAASRNRAESFHCL